MHSRQGPQRQHDEQRACQVEGQNQRTQRTDGTDPVLADGERHGTECAQRRQSHDQIEHGEQHAGEGIDGPRGGLTCRPDPRQCEPEQDRQQQHRQHFPFRKGAEEGLGNDMQDEFDKAHAGAGLRILSRDGRIKLLRVHVHARARLGQVHHGPADQQCDDCQQIEQGERLEQSLPDLFGFAQPGHAADDGAEHHRRDHHLDQLDETIAQRLEGRAEIRPEMSGRDTGHDADQDLDVQRLENRSALHSPPPYVFFCCAVHPVLILRQPALTRRPRTAEPIREVQREPPVNAPAGRAGSAACRPWVCSACRLRCGSWCGCRRWSTDHAPSSPRQDHRCGRPRSC